MAFDQVHRYAPRQRYSMSARRRRMRVWIVVGCFLGFVALAWAWAFHRGPATGGSDVPVLAADPQPTRERPTDPGGMKVVDIDPLSYDSGRSPPHVENILPAPEKPLPPPAPPPVPAPAAAIVAPPSAAPALAVKADAVAVATSEPAPTQPVAAPVAKPQPPKVKPVAFREEAKPKPEAKPIEVTPGSYRLQLASLRSAADAHASAAKLRSRFGSVLGSAGFSVVSVNLPGRGTYFRVMAGPMSHDAASHICDSLRQRGAACLLAR